MKSNAVAGGLRGNAPSFMPRRQTTLAGNTLPRRQTGDRHAVGQPGNSARLDAGAAHECVPQGLRTAPRISAPATAHSLDEVVYQARHGVDLAGGLRVEVRLANEEALENLGAQALRPVIGRLCIGDPAIQFAGEVAVADEGSQAFESPAPDW